MADGTATPDGVTSLSAFTAPTGLVAAILTGVAAVAVCNLPLGAVEISPAGVSSTSAEHAPTGSGTASVTVTGRSATSAIHAPVGGDAAWPCGVSAISGVGTATPEKEDYATQMVLSPNFMSLYLANGLNSGIIPVVSLFDPSTALPFASGYIPVHVASASTSAVKLAKQGLGVLGSIVVNTLGTGTSTISVYDGLDTTGKLMAIINSASLSGSFKYDSVFRIGCYVAAIGTATPDFTVNVK